MSSTPRPALLEQVGGLLVDLERRRHPAVDVDRSSIDP
jgi:hypothetical protein